MKELKKLKWPIDVVSVHLYPASTGTPADRVELHQAGQGRHEEVQGAGQQAAVGHRDQLRHRRPRLGQPRQEHRGPDRGGLGRPRPTSTTSSTASVAPTGTTGSRTPTSSASRCTTAPSAPSATRRRATGSSGAFYSCTDGRREHLPARRQRHSEGGRLGRQGLRYLYGARECDHHVRCAQPVHAGDPGVASDDWKHAAMVRNTRKLVAIAATVAAVSLTGDGLLVRRIRPRARRARRRPPRDRRHRPPRACPPSLVGMHVEGAEAGAWPSAPFGALRLWDNGTAWSQIELEPGVYKWDNLEGVLENAQSKGMTDILMVLGTTPEWNAKKISPDDYPQPGAASAPKDLDGVGRLGHRGRHPLQGPHLRVPDLERGQPQELLERHSRGDGRPHEARLRHHQGDRPRGPRRVRVAVDPAHRPVRQVLPGLPRRARGQGLADRRGRHPHLPVRRRRPRRARRWSSRPSGRTSRRPAPPSCRCGTPS